MPTEKLKKSNLVVYKMRILDGEDKSLGLSQVSIVAYPATNISYLTFSDEQKKPIPLKLSVTDQDEQICFGPALVPNLPILRNEQGHEYILLATENDIFQTVLKFNKEKKNNNVDLEHDGQLVTGITMMDNFITNEKRGILPPTGFSDQPWGTWFVSYKVDNPDIWASIKAGEFSGFSITGLFDLEKTDLVFDVEQEDKLNPQNIYDDFADILDGFEG